MAAWLAKGIKGGVGEKIDALTIHPFILRNYKQKYSRNHREMVKRRSSKMVERLSHAKDRLKKSLKVCAQRNGAFNPPIGPIPSYETMK